MAIVNHQPYCPDCFVSNGGHHTWDCNYAVSDYKPPVKKCECGVVAIGYSIDAPVHSWWCPAVKK